MKRDMEPVAVVKKPANIVEVGGHLKDARVNREAAELARELLLSLPKSPIKLWLISILDNKLVELNKDIDRLTKTILTAEM